VSASGSVYVVLPAGVDDPAAPSGGNTYDRRVCGGLTAMGWSVREIHAAGAWPRPADHDRADLARALDAVPDGALVLLDGLVAGGAPEILVPRAARLRLVVLSHLPLADETSLAPTEAAELDALERQTLRSVSAVIATSAAARRRLIDHHGLAAAQVHVATPGTDAAPLASGTDDGSQLVCVASVTPRKGQDLLVEALAGVSDLRWTCACVGAVGHDGGYVGRVRGLIETYQLDGRVRLVGPRAGDELAATYAEADLLVLASRAETYGMVVSEALARGVPVLATAVDGVAEALGHASDGSVPGMLTPAADPTAFSAAVRRWLTEPALRQRLRASARDRRATLQRWDVTSRRLAEVLGAVIAEPVSVR
jgi:glycosyltransferase involved in cell wall biosynthesis